MSLPPVAVLAGGLATRLRPVSLTLPKAMAPVCGEPFCAIQLRQLKRQGFDRVVFLLGVMGQQIRDFVDDGSRYELDVDYVEDGPVPLGTGGAVVQAMPLLGERFFVTYGDTFLRYDAPAVVEVLERTGADAVMTVLRNRDQWDRSNVVLEGDRVRRYDKRAEDRAGMEWIDYGATLFEARAFADRAPGETFDLADQVKALADAGRLGGYETADRFYEIGTPAALEEANAFFRTHAV